MKFNRQLMVTAIVIIGIESAVIAILSILFRDDSLSRCQKTGTIRIGYAVEAPYAYLTSDGEVTGESTEIAKKIVGQLGIPRIIWQQMDFGALIPELEAGRIDVIAAGMFVTPERGKRIAFSIPTFRVRQGLLVPKGNPRKLHSYRQAAMQPDLKIAILAGAVEADMLKELGMEANRLILMPDALTGKIAVESGVADAMALSLPTVKWMAVEGKLGGIEAAQPFESNGDMPASFGAFAFRKEDRKLLSAWNAGLKTFIGTPEHLSLIARFGFSTEELPDL